MPIIKNDEAIYTLSLDIKNKNIPFAINRSISVSSGDLVKVFSEFQVKFIGLLAELEREQGAKISDDDIPF